VRHGDEVFCCGQMFRTGGARVVTWLDHGGYDGYCCTSFFQQETERSVGPRHSARRRQGKRVRQWTLEELQEVVHQVVVHYDGCGTARRCFKVLHDERGLSCHFIVDLDGTIYQTLDLKERAWHATSANDVSVGIEVVNLGAHGGVETLPWDEWYKMDKDGTVTLQVPKEFVDPNDPMLRRGAPVLCPATNSLLEGRIHGLPYKQYDFTEPQYESLCKLVASLTVIFPRVKLAYPVDKFGLVTTKLPDKKLAHFEGILGHYHVQLNKIDPGPAFQWEKLISGAKLCLQLE